MSPRSARRIAFLGLALAGTLVGHSLTYVLAIRSVAHRGEHLARAGHSYWGAAVWVASAVVACGVVALVLSAFRRHRVSYGGPGTWEAIILAATQIGGFLVLEGLERTASGAGFGDLVSHDLMALGILVQALVAMVGALLLRWLMRAAGLLASIAEQLPRATIIPSAPPGPAALRAVMPGGGWGLRGPPRVDPS